MASQNRHIALVLIMMPLDAEQGVLVSVAIVACASMTATLVAYSRGNFFKLFPAVHLLMIA